MYKEENNETREGKKESLRRVPFMWWYWLLLLLLPDIACDKSISRTWDTRRDIFYQWALCGYTGYVYMLVEIVFSIAIGNKSEQFQRNWITHTFIVCNWCCSLPSPSGAKRNQKKKTKWTSKTRRKKSEVAYFIYAEILVGYKWHSSQLNKRNIYISMSPDR